VAVAHTGPAAKQALWQDPKEKGPVIAGVGFHNGISDRHGVELRLRKNSQYKVRVARVSGAFG